MGTGLIITRLFSEGILESFMLLAVTFINAL